MYWTGHVARQTCTPSLRLHVQPVYTVAGCRTVGNVDMRQFSRNGYLLQVISSEVGSGGVQWSVVNGQSRLSRALETTITRRTRVISTKVSYQVQVGMI